MWVDSHAHLAEEDYDSDRNEVIQRAKDAGIGKILLIGCGIAGAKRALSVALTDEIFDAAVGFHPEDIENLSDADWTLMEEMASHPRTVAIGEIGLDFYWHHEPEHHQLQKEIFTRQIDLANRLGKPILIHTRDAIQQTLQLLKTHPVDKKGIMHCYSGSVEMAIEFVKLGYLISLAGPVTFKNAVVPKEVAKAIDLDHLMIETDSPYLTPMPFRGKRNESSYVVNVAKEICQLKAIDEVKLKTSVWKNYNHLFHE